MKDKRIFIILAIITGLVYCVTLLSYILTKQFIDLVLSAISGVLTIINIYTIYKINKNEKGHKRHCRKKIKLTKEIYRLNNKKHK